MLHSARYTRTASVRVELQGDLVADKHFYPVQTHFSGEVREYQFTRIEPNPKERIRERFFHDSLYNCRFGHICAEDSSNKRAVRQALSAC